MSKFGFLVFFPNFSKVYAYSSIAYMWKYHSFSELPTVSSFSFTELIEDWLCVNAFGCYVGCQPDLFEEMLKKL